MLFRKSLLIASVTALFTLAACGGSDNNSTANGNSPTPATEAPAPSSNNPASSSLPENVPTVTILTSTSFAPFAYLDVNVKEVDNMRGFDVDVIKSALATQGIKAKIEPTLWKNTNEVLENLNTKKADIILGAVAATEARKAKFAASDIYVEAPNAILVLENSPIQTLADLKDKKIVVQDTSTALDDLEKAGLTEAVASKKPGFEALSLVARKEMDAIAGDELALRNISKSFPAESKMRVIKLPESFGSVAFFVSKDNPDLLKKINAGLATIKQNGTYDKIYREWFN
ncbi:transporter substrate-binding domain-containing protein [Kingella kingae]|uniref:Amino acid ABC superfamily ATP binding cassette transporter, binding protein n=2 Tax=Kingella kingae TaxID=504 RepID=F5S9N1_KINKI|nr:transporter substrate-binding domain-containing protein [Kingella kingae]EGK07031.1 amino acid ABC superfamily ATP binding cassette transporter, binding protein [Kingella kingae ATCC 23330]MDK4534521.1 transporter substrate-binding domain-containing protein [Kingella kingae]MDK4541013.1 transporter substrate-binding domain-containing protein [Kingella kingae]MDK4544686.1 transporter substrate-binding domain-containing protein [Kingella kingae]MDK4553542.1 transporter substrate-binding domai